MTNQESIQRQNDSIKNWASTTFTDIKARYISLIRGEKHSGAGLNSLKLKTSMQDGEINRVKFGFNRYLIFVHKGAGKGKGGAKGSTWYDKFGRSKSTSLSSLGKMNTGGRNAEEWLNPVLDDDVPKLADIVKGLKTEAVIDAIRIRES